MKEPNLEKMDAIQAARNTLLEIMDSVAESQDFDVIVDLLDQADEYLRYIESLETLETLERTRRLRSKNGLIYHLMKKHKESKKPHDSREK